MGSKEIGLLISDNFTTWGSAWQSQENAWAPREQSDQHGYLPSLISLRCALNGLLRTAGFYVWTGKPDKTGQMYRLICSVAARTKMVGLAVTISPPMNLKTLEWKTQNLRPIFAAANKKYFTKVVNLRNISIVGIRLSKSHFWVGEPKKILDRDGHKQRPEANRILARNSKYWEKMSLLTCGNYKWQSGPLVLES